MLNGSIYTAITCWSTGDFLPDVITAQLKKATVNSAVKNSSSSCHTAETLLPITCPIHPDYISPRHMFDISVLTEKQILLSMKIHFFKNRFNHQVKPTLMATCITRIQYSTYNIIKLSSYQNERNKYFFLIHWPNQWRS